MTPPNFSDLDCIYEGKAKKVWSKAGDDDYVVIEFKDHLTAFNGQKHAEVAGKGELCCGISWGISQYLADHGVRQHALRRLTARTIWVERLKMIPVEVVVRNVWAGSLAKRYGRSEGERLRTPMIELYLKDDSLGDPLLIDAMVHELQLIDDPQTLQMIRTAALKINRILIELFQSVSIDLIDFKLEFGQNRQGQLILGDEISPDSLRLWDQTSQEHLDKDVFRRDLGDVALAYQEVFNRLNQRGLKVKYEMGT